MAASERVALGTVGSIAGKAAVQPSTMVRFAQSLGYSGFSDLQEIFKEYIKGCWPEPRARAATARHRASRARRSHLHLVARAGRRLDASLGRIGETIDPHGFDADGRALAKAELIHLVGSKRAFPVTTYLSLALSQLGIAQPPGRQCRLDRVRPDRLRRPARRRAGDQLQPLQLDHAGARRARRSEARRIVSITDSTFSPLVPISDAWIEVVESDFAGFRSIAATLAVGMAVVLGVAKHREAEEAPRPRAPASRVKAAPRARGRGGLVGGVKSREDRPREEPRWRRQKNFCPIRRSAAATTGSARSAPA